MLSTIINIIEIVVAILLITSILLQASGSGLGAAFGGGDSIQRTKRGAEKTIFQSTIVLSVIFFALALANVII